MKKNILNLIIFLLIGYLFTGCSAIVVKSSFQKEFINYELKKHIKKTNKLKINIIKTNSKSELAPSGFVGSAFANHTDKNFNNNITKEFFKQYFDVVEISNNKLKDYLNVTSKLELKKYDYSAGQTINLDIDLHINITKNKKIIFNKKYRIKESSVSTPIILSEFNMSNLYKEKMHKTYLKIYEKYIKKDLLTALKENL